MKGTRVTTLTVSELRRQSDLRQQVEVRRLRAGLFRLGGYLGWDAKRVVQFSETVTGRRWRRCGRAELEQVVLTFGEVAKRVRAAAKAG
jgi:hypothetical protein